MKRGEVWLVRFPPVGVAVGREQAGTRPALVVSIDGLNGDTVVVVPITSRLRDGIPSRIGARPPEGGLTLPSHIIGEQPMTVSTHRFASRLGRVKPATMARVEGVLRIVLGL